MASQALITSFLKPPGTAADLKKRPRPTLSVVNDDDGDDDDDADLQPLYLSAAQKKARRRAAFQDMKRKKTTK